MIFYMLDSVEPAHFLPGHLYPAQPSKPLEMMLKYDSKAVGAALKSCAKILRTWTEQNLQSDEDLEEPVM